MSHGTWIVILTAVPVAYLLIRLFVRAGKFVFELQKNTEATNQLTQRFEQYVGGLNSVTGRVDGHDIKLEEHGRRLDRGGL